MGLKCSANPKRVYHVCDLLKSDQNGIEMGTCDLRPGHLGGLKSDQNGIETFTTMQK